MKMMGARFCCESLRHRQEGNPEGRNFLDRGDICQARAID